MIWDYIIITSYLKHFIRKMSSQTNDRLSLSPLSSAQDYQLQHNDIIIIPLHRTPASSECWQLCCPRPELEHSNREVSVPTQATSSNQIGPTVQ